MSGFRRVCPRTDGRNLRHPNALTTALFCSIVGFDGGDDSQVFGGHRIWDEPVVQPAV